MSPGYAAAFAIGAAWDAVAAPPGLLRARHRLAARALREAGQPERGALRLDLALLRRRRRQRRFRTWLRRHAPDQVMGALRIEGAEPFLEAAGSGGGAIVATGHGGPREAATLAFRALGLDVLELRQSKILPWDPPPRVLSLAHGATPGQGGRWLVTALRELRAGGIVRIPIDGFSPSRRSRVRVMGVSVPAAGGMAALARLAAVPVFPLVAEVARRGDVSVRFGPAVGLLSLPAADASAWEQDFLDRTHAAIDALLDGHELERLARVVTLLRMRDFEDALHAERAP